MQEQEKKNFTTIIISHDIAEGPERIWSINKWFGSESGFNGQNLGEGHFLYVGCFPDFEEEAFLDHLDTFSWHYPQYLQVMIREETEEEFRTLYPCFDHNLLHIECQHCFQRVR